jgi:hypothetical protein
MPFYTRLGFEPISNKELSFSLCSVIQEEIRLGLDPTRRVAMRRRFVAFADDFFSCVHMKSKTIALDYVVVNRKKNNWSVS